MNNSIKEYARLGLVHHMLYARCLNDPEYHEKTLVEMAARTDIETFDCCLPYGAERQERLAQAIRASGKEHVVFATHLFPLRKLSFCSTSYSEQAQARMVIADMVRQSASIGATGFIFASGGPPAAEATAANKEAFYDFCCWLCGELAPHGIDALLEPFDFDFDKQFAFGPLDENLELARRVAAQHPNFGIELDVAHLPLMREDMLSSIRRSAPWLRRVHLGNCVMRDRGDPFYGDKHPPIGYPGGEIDTAQLVDVLGELLNVGFLDRDNRGDLVVELNPFPAMSEDASVADNFRRVNEAWAQVSPE